MAVVAGRAVTAARSSVLLHMLEAVEGTFCLLEMLEVSEVIRCVLLCM